MDPTELPSRQYQAVLDGEVEVARDLAHEAIATGADLERCIEQGYVAGIREVGRLWEEGEYFLPELVQGAEAMTAAMGVLRPALLARGGGSRERRKVVLGTVQGDIHDIGKTLVATVLEANGFEVVDLGKDVPDEEFVAAVEREAPVLVGMSALLTTTMGGQRRVIERLRERGLTDRVRVMVGGAPVTRRFAEEVGADGWAADAMAALLEAHRLVGGEE